MYGIRGTALRRQGPIHQKGDLADLVKAARIANKCTDANNDLHNVFLVSSLKQRPQTAKHRRDLVGIVNVHVLVATCMYMCM